MKKRSFLKLISAVSAIALFLSGCTGQQGASQESHNTGLFAMGTYMTLTAYGENAEAALDSAKGRITDLESLWSVTDENSEIYKINHSGGIPVAVSPETEELIRFTLDIADQTNGALDPTIYPLVDAWGFISGEHRIPTQAELQQLLKNTGYEKVSIAENTVTIPDGVQLDLGAVGKGYTGDILSESLKSQGVSSALLDIGGNIQMIGRKPDGTKWRMGIKNPFGDGSFGILEAEDCAVVTSGGYERYFTGEDGKDYWHILDPQTGMPAQGGLVSVTIIAQEGRLCDALSTAVFVMGLEEGIEYWRSRNDFEMLLMTQDGEIFLTEGIQDDFTLEASFSEKEPHVIE